MIVEMIETPPAITHELCLRAQGQCLNAIKRVTPRYSPVYGPAGRVGGFRFSDVPWSDLVTRRLYTPALGWMRDSEYFAWKGRNDVTA